jgi:hypothetical protein
MKHIIKILFLLFLPALAYSQGGTWPVKYNDSDPSGAPSASGTRIYFNTATNTLWFWEPAPSSTWRKQPKAFDQITGCAAPAYTPTARQSTFAVNSCDPPELYQYTGAAWELLNAGTTYTAGTGIDITGGVISNTGDLSATNELNTALYVDMGSLIVEDAGGTVSTPLSQLRGIYTEGTGIDIDFGTGAITNTLPNVVQTLSIAGQDLTLSGGGGTVEIPGGASDALGTGFTAGGGTGTIPDGTVITTGNTIISFNNLPTPVTLSGSSSINEPIEGFPFVGFGSNDGANAYNFGFYDEGGGIISPIIGGLNLSTGNNSFLQLASSYIGLSTSFSGIVSRVATNSNGIDIFTAGAGRILVTDNSTSKKGLQYNADYSATIAANPRSIPDVGTTKQIISDSLGSIGVGFVNGGGNGTIPTTNAILQGDLQIDNGVTKAIAIGDLNGDGNGTGMYLSDGQVMIGDIYNGYSYLMSCNFSGDPSTWNTDITAAADNFHMDLSGAKFTSGNTGLGMEYAADYSATIVENPRSIPDVGTVDLLKQTPVSYDNASAPNNCIFYSTTVSKLCYKDPGGTVNPLY